MGARWVGQGNRGALIAGFLLMLSCGYDGPMMSVDELKVAVEDPKQGVTVIDVRPAVQFGKGHVPGALNSPDGDLEQMSRWTDSAKGSVAIICTCGRRSLDAVKKLARQGRTTILVKGGMKQWEAEGYPLERGN